MAFRGQGLPQQRALAILGDPERAFASSEFVRLELLPKAIWHQNTDEIAFYNTFFNSVSYWADISETLLKIAYQEAGQHGLAAVDALHIAAAKVTKADELITSEKLEKPLHRSTSVKVRSITI